MFKKYRYCRKKKDVLFFKHIPLFVKKLKTLKKPTIFIKLPLAEFKTTKLDRKEKRNMLKIHRKLCNLGYLLDKKTISFFVAGKKTQAYRCIRKFISYYIKSDRIISEESITNVIQSQILHGIGQQFDGSLTIEMIDKHVDMRTLCINTVTHVILVSICNYITYDALKKGISFVRDLSDYRLRLWNDRKLFVATKIIHSVFPVVLIVLVDPPCHMKTIFYSLLNATSKKNSTIIYAVKRPAAFRNKLFQQNRLPELQKKFPSMRISTIFGGTDDHLLKMVSATKCFLTTICLKFEADLNYVDSSSGEISTVLPIDLSKLAENESHFTLNS